MSASIAQLREAREQLERTQPGTRIAAQRVLELREVPNGHGGNDLLFTGFASVTCVSHDDQSNAYEMEDAYGPWIESVQAGAFRNTLNQGADVAFLINHAGMSLARTKPGTLKLSEQLNPTSSPVPGVTGLYSEARLDLTNPQNIALRSAIERGDLDEMSFAFRVVRQEWNNDYTRRWINEVNLDKGDVSIVNYGANPHTGGTVDLRQHLGSRAGHPSQDRAAALGRRRAHEDFDVRLAFSLIPNRTEHARMEVEFMRSPGTGPSRRNGDAHRTGGTAR